MQRAHDERGKLIAEQTLDALGAVRREVEVPSTDAQRMDLWFQRHVQLRGVPGYLDLLNRIFFCSCIVELFGKALGMEDFCESLRKQYGFRKCQQEQRKAKGDEALPFQDVPQDMPQDVPMMWLISAGRPQTLLQRRPFVPWQDLGAGIYLLESWFIGLVVVSELPQTKETLLLRLLGTKAVRRQALMEIIRLPKDDPETATLRRIVAGLRHTLQNATSITQEDREEFMTPAWAEFERHEEELRKEGHREGHREGHQEGRKEGLLSAIHGLCEVLNIPLGATKQAQIAALDLPSLESLWTYLKTRRVLPPTFPPA